MIRPSSALRRFLRLHWQEGIAVALFAACLLRVWAGHRWLSDLKPFAFALLGLVSFIASEEVAMTTGGYGWTRAQWWEHPPGYVKWTGAILLVACSIRLLAY